jgi:hypothetical protein
LKNKKFKLEKDAVKKAANQKQHDVIFDVLKKWIVLEKMGASKEYLEKYFWVTHLAKIYDLEDSSDDADSSSRSDWAACLLVFLDFIVLTYILFESNMILQIHDIYNYSDSRCLRLNNNILTLYGLAMAPQLGKIFMCTLL